MNKQHFVLLAAIVIIAANLLITTRFVSNARHVMRLQASESVHLPTVRPKKDEIAVKTLTFTIRAGGAVFADNKLIESAALGDFLRAKAPERVTVQTVPGVQYEELKAFLGTLGTHGVQNVTLKVNGAAQ